MANIKISELNELTKSQRAYDDYLAIVDSSANETKKISLENIMQNNIQLLAVTDTAPSECNIGDKYFNTDTGLIYTATGTDTWGTVGEEPIEDILYVVFSEKNTYAWNGTDMLSVGGGSGSEIVIGDESEATEDTKLLVDTSGSTDELKYKDETTGTFKDLEVKALDSMPVGTIVDYDGQASDIPAGWETYGTGQIKKTSETRPLTATVVNEYNDSQENAYSTEYVNNAINPLQIYGAETKIGKWFNKYLYRQCFEIAYTGRNTKILDFNYAQYIKNMKAMLIRTDGYGSDISWNSPTAGTGDFGILYVNYQNNAIMFNSSFVGTIYLNIEYTKN